MILKIYGVEISTEKLDQGFYALVGRSRRKMELEIRDWVKRSESLDCQVFLSLPSFFPGKFLISDKMSSVVCQMLLLLDVNN